jgi:hypothetical protein
MVIFSLTKQATDIHNPFNNEINETIIDYLEHKMSILTHDGERAYNSALNDFVKNHQSEDINDFIKQYKSFPFFILGTDSQIKFYFTVEYLDSQEVKGALDLHESFDCFGRKGKWLE